MQACFERGRANPAFTAETVVLACGEECAATWDPYPNDDGAGEYSAERLRELAACSVQGGTSSGYSEAEADAGPPIVCATECFPGWE